MQKEWIELIEKHDKVSIMAFRTSGKSEALFVCYPIFKAFTQKNWQGIVISNTLQQAVELMKRIRYKLLENEFLRSSIPDNIREASWSKTEIELKNRSRILCRTYTENIRGYHVNWVGCDEAGEYQDHSIFFNAIQFIVKRKKGKIVVCGTPKSEIDLLHVLQSRSDWISKKYPAIIDGKSALPDLYSLEDLEKMRLADSLAFAREMMCNPISTEDQLFPYDLIKESFDESRILEFSCDPTKKYFMGVDFAFTMGTGVRQDYDYTAIVVLEKDKDKLIVKNIRRERGLGYEHQKAIVKEFFALYNRPHIYLDSRDVGISFYNDFLKDGMIVTAYKYNHQSKIDLMQNLRRAFEQGKIVIPRKRETRTIVLTDLLIQELQAIMPVKTRGGNITYEGKGQHDDLVNALALAVYAATKHGEGGFNIVATSHRKNLFYIA